MILKKFRVFLLNQSILQKILARFSNDLDKFSRLEPKKENTKEKKKKEMCMIQL